MIHINHVNIYQTTETAVTLGNFDGMHLGHQKLVDTVKQDAVTHGYKSVVFSFLPHPLSIFHGDVFRTLFTSEEKAFTLNNLGVDIFIEYPFNKEVASLEPEAFIREIIVKQLKCKVLVVGEDYHFGRGQQGDKALLRKLGGELDFEVKIIPHIMLGDEKISSTYVRNLVLARRFEEVESLLSAPYFAMGVVESGKKLGRTIGVPTVNIIAPENKLLPPAGVYCTKVHYGGSVYNGLTNVGTNPTFSGKIKTIETYMFNFNEEIYGKQIKVDFYKWIRDEIKFQDIEQLKKQIYADIEQGKLFFKF